MRELEYNGLVTYLVAMDREEHPNLSWIYRRSRAREPRDLHVQLLPRAGGEDVLPDRDHDAGRPAFPEQELEQEVLQGLEVAGLLKREEILFTDRSQVNHAYVVFDHGYQQRRGLVLDWMESQGLNPMTTSVASSTTTRTSASSRRARSRGHAAGSARLGLFRTRARLGRLPLKNSVTVVMLVASGKKPVKGSAQ